MRRRLSILSTSGATCGGNRKIQPAIFGARVPRQAPNARPIFFPMPRLPDRFDLFVRRARASADPARQLDYVLGALAGLPEWYFLNGGTRQQPRVFTTEIEQTPILLVFSDSERVLELAAELRIESPREAPPVITIPTTAALPWCVSETSPPWHGLLINPGEDAVLVPRPQVEAFASEWQTRGGRQASGFWIPNLTGEEEDFWQEYGL